MAKTLARDLQAGQSLAVPFVVKEKRLYDFKSKPGQYLSLVLADATGEINARMWDRVEEYAPRFDEGDVVRVTGKVESYRGQLQIIVNHLDPCTEDEYDPADLVARTDKDVHQLYQDLENTARSVTDPHLKQLLLRFLEDSEIAPKLLEAPAAKSLHHSYLGGLVEHLRNVVVVCETLLANYPVINRDLLLTGALLHDVGKLRELSWGLATEYTDEGRLLGHIVLGAEMAGRWIDEIEGFPVELRLRILHMILSHHGQTEWGSPKRPKTPEAFALHLAENADAQMKNFLQVMEAEGSPGKAWTGYSRALERYLFQGYPLSEEEAASSGPAPTKDPS